MKRISLFIFALLAVLIPANAQIGVFNHLAVSAHVGTTGFGFEAASPITSWVVMRAGVTIMPGITFGTSTSVEATIPELGARSYDVDVDGDLGRTQGSVIFNVYPFTQRIPVYVAAGAYFGGNKLLKVKGHSDQLEADIKQYPGMEANLEIGDYLVPVDKTGSLYGDMRTKAFRPYLGLGWGRAIPSRLLAFNVELGVQFQGKMKVYDTYNVEANLDAALDSDDTLQKIIDKVTVYPVLKFTLSGKIF